MPPQLASGSTFAGYRVEEEIGRGGMGVVYRAIDLSLERPVALKLIAPELASEEGFRKRFLRETRVAASLGHPHVLPVYAAGEADGQLYLAMRYVQGEDLKSLLEREGRLQPERALALAGQVAEALDAAHRRGLVHRDVKPGNVLLDEDGQAYLSDFGLAKQLTRESAASATGQLVGTLDYLAPEQIRGEEVDGRTDEYALACLLYECLAGRPPFRRPTEAEVLWGHMQEEPPPLRDYPALDPVLGRGLAKAKEERYGTCSELVDTAREALGLETPRLRRRRRLLRRSRVLIATGSLVLAGGIAAVVVELTTSGSADRVEVQPNSVAMIDPKTNRVVDDIPVGNGPSELALAEGALWVLNGNDRTVSRVDLASRSVRTISVGGTPTDLTVGNGAVWIVDGFAGTVFRVNTDSGVVEHTIRLPLLDPEGERFRSPAFIASGRGGTWVSGGIGPNASASQTAGPAFAPYLWRLDPRRVRVVSTRRGSGSYEGGGDIAVGEGAVWAVGQSLVLRIDAHSNTMTTIDTGETDAVTGEIATGARAVWVADRDGTLSKIDAFTQQTVRTITVGLNARGVAVGAGSVWVADPTEGAVVQVDPTNATVLRSIRLSGTPNGVAVGDGAVWISID